MSAMDPERRLTEARDRATRARLRFVSALQGTQRRLSLGRLKSDALAAAGDKVQEVRTDVQQALRRHPVITGSAALGFLALLFWKPARTAAFYGMRGAQLVWLNRRLWRRMDDD